VSWFSGGDGLVGSTMDYMRLFLGYKNADRMPDDKEQDKKRPSEVNPGKVFYSG